VPTTEPIATGGTCSTTVNPCQPPVDDCLSSALKMTLWPTFNACGFYCGDFAVGFSAGCVTSVTSLLSPPSAGTDDPQWVAGVACLKNALFGARFDCVLADGWQRVYVGSCTLY
jgi:hypothetical protein